MPCSLDYLHVLNDVRLREDVVAESVLEILSEDHGVAAVQNLALAASPTYRDAEHKEDLIYGTPAYFGFFSRVVVFPIATLRNVFF